ncbi:hypothetical protein KKE26_03960 [bacterium]|nr:hypothetical protein [bacterium]MBU1753461.1 hypothetical protein [bacterium]
MRKEQKIIEEKIIEMVLEFLSKTTEVDYKVTEIPDEEERNLPACDAIACVGSISVAVEHTSIDSFPWQRRDNERIIKALGPLKTELTGKLPTTGHYDLGVYHNTIPNINWKGLRNEISKWCQEVAPNLEIGSRDTAPRHFVKGVIQEMPVVLSRWDEQDGQFGISCSIENLEKQREEVINNAFNSRGSKVVSYREKGYRTILILESENDRCLATIPFIGKAFRNTIKKIDLMELPDEVYLCFGVTNKPPSITPLKFGNTIWPDVVISKEPYK